MVCVLGKKSQKSNKAWGILVAAWNLKVPFITFHKFQYNSITVIKREWTEPYD